MSFETQIQKNDRIRLNILSEVLSGLIHLDFALDDAPGTDYASGIHSSDRTVNVLGKFNLREDPAANSIIIRHVAVEGRLKLTFRAAQAFSGKTAEIICGANKKVEQTFEISSELASIELIPEERKSYRLKTTTNTDSQLGRLREPEPVPQPAPAPIAEPVPSRDPVVEHIDTQVFQGGSNSGFGSYSDPRFGGGQQSGGFGSYDPPVFNNYPQPKPQPQPQPFAPSGGAGETDEELNLLERQISLVEQKQSQLSQKKQSAIAHLEQIEAEYKKDYAALEGELNDLKSRMEADSVVLEYYQDRDVIPVETILREVQLKLTEAEEQIRFFVEAKQKKTMEIEKEIKSTK